MSAEPLRRLREALESHPQRMAEAAERVRQVAGQAVTAESGDGAVQVVAAGTGDIVTVRILGDRRHLDSQTLSTAVVEATNAALDAVDRLRTALLPSAVGMQDPLADAEHDFTHRMDGLLSAMDRLGHLLDDQLGTTDAAVAPAPE